MGPTATVVFKQIANISEKRSEPYMAACYTQTSHFSAR